MYRRGDLGQVARALRIVNALRGFKRGRTLAALAAEVDVSVRTVRRDLADLVDADLKIELVAVDGQPGARLVDRGYTTVPITTRELFTLFAVRSVFDVLRGTPLHDDVLSVLLKLEQRLDPDDLPRQRRMGERIAYVPDGGTKAYDDKEDVIDALQTGILSQKVVRYTYKDSRGRSQHGHLAPYALVLYRQGLYVIGPRLSGPADGKDTTQWRRRLGLFAVERFTDAVHLRERTFDVAPEFRLEDVLHGAFGIHVGHGEAPPARRDRVQQGTGIVRPRSRVAPNAAARRSARRTRSFHVLVRRSNPCRFVGAGVGPSRQGDRARATPGPGRRRARPGASTVCMTPPPSLRADSGRGARRALRSPGVLPTVEQFAAPATPCRRNRRQGSRGSRLKFKRLGATIAAVMRGPVRFREQGGASSRENQAVAGFDFAVRSRERKRATAP